MCLSAFRVLHAFKLSHNLGRNSVASQRKKQCSSLIVYGLQHHELDSNGEHVGVINGEHHSVGCLFCFALSSCHSHVIWANVGGRTGAQHVEHIWNTIHRKLKTTWTHAHFEKHLCMAGSRENKDHAVSRADVFFLVCGTRPSSSLSFPLLVFMLPNQDRWVCTLTPHGQQWRST